MLDVLLLRYAVAGDLNRPFHSCVHSCHWPLNENEARVNFVLIETSLLSLIYATQDSRMTNKWHVRVGMHSLVQHFLVILPS